jgi:hypothetical protein
MGRLGEARWVRGVIFPLFAIALGACGIQNMGTVSDPTEQPAAGRGGASGAAGGVGKASVSAGGSTAIEASCQASLDSVKVACTAEDPSAARLCLYEALRPLCSSGRTPFVQAIFDCLTADACQTPSDPSDASACVEAAVHRSATAADHALGHQLCECEGDSPEPNCAADEPSESLVNLMLLAPADASAFSDCLATNGCAAQESCLSGTALARANACPGL